MPKYDFSAYEETTSLYGPGKHKVRFGKWEMKESKSGKVFLEMPWEKDGHHGKDGRSFTTSRLYFSSPQAAGMSKHKLHLLCDKMGLKYTGKDMFDNEEKILAVGAQLEGQELEIELVPTGGQNENGKDYLGVRITGVGNLFIPVDSEETNSWSSVDEAVGTEESDIPF